MYSVYVIAIYDKQSVQSKITLIWKFDPLEITNNYAGKCIIQQVSNITEVKDYFFGQNAIHFIFKIKLKT